MTGTIRNLGQAARMRMLVEITCEPCGRTATFRASDLLMMARPSLEIEGMRGKCIDCGAVTSALALMEGPDDKPRSMLWVPSRLR